MSAFGPAAAPTPVFSPLLSALSGVRHAFFTRAGGVSEGLYDSLNLGVGSADAGERVAENRRRAAAWFGLEPERLLTCRQIHSARILTAASGRAWGRPEGDGVATASPGLICAALHADCAPILLADPEAGVVAAVHAGWRGALGGAAEAGVAAMVALGARKEAVVAAVGPCIGPASYEVGLEFLERFVREDGAAASFFAEAERSDKRRFDLPGYVLMRLARAGVANSAWTGGDTVVEDRAYFSNRRAVLKGEGDYGRLASAIVLAD